jgi:hypothetical protein
MWRLQRLENAVNALIKEAENSSKSTISSLQAKLDTMLAEPTKINLIKSSTPAPSTVRKGRRAAQQIVSTSAPSSSRSLRPSSRPSTPPSGRPSSHPSTSVAPSSEPTRELESSDFARDIVKMSVNDEKLCLELELSWTSKEIKSLHLDLEDISAAIGALGKVVVPGRDEGLITTDVSLKFQLRLEVEKNSDGSINTYILEDTGFLVTFMAAPQDTPDVHATVGPYSALIKSGAFSVGDSSDPLALVLRVTQNTLVHDQLEPQSIVETTFEGSINANYSLEVPTLGFDAPIGVNLTFQDVGEFFRGQNLEQFITGNFPNPVPVATSLFELLHSESGAFSDSLEDMFRMFETVLFGSNDRAISSFNIPFLQGGVLDTLGVSPENNFLAAIRRLIVPLLRDNLADLFNLVYNTTGFDPIAETTKKIESALNETNLLSTNSRVTTQCNDGQVVECNTHDVTSVMWTLPLGQEIRVKLPLDFNLDPKFPLHVSLGGANAPALLLQWNFILSFGMDKDDGFFFPTILPGGESELRVSVSLEAMNQSFQAGLFFLAANMENFDLIVGANVFVNLREPGGSEHGRLTLGNLRKIRDWSSLFEYSAIAGAVLQAPEITLGLELSPFGDSSNPEENSKFEKFSKWIPELQFALDAGISKTVGSVSKEDSATILENVHPQVGGRALSIHRTLQSGGGLQLADCAVEGEDSCAVVRNIAVRAKPVEQFLENTLGKIVDDYLEPVLKPLDTLIERLPGISDIAGRDITGELKQLA